MIGSIQLHKLERFITNDSHFLATLISCTLIFTIYVNLSAIQSFAIGIIAFVLYFMINAIFLAQAFFEKEDAFSSLMFGALLLIMLLGFVGLLVMIIHNLDVPMFTMVLLTTTTISSLSNRRMKNKSDTH